MMLVFAFQSEIWIVQNFNFTVFEDFCLSLPWKYRFLQNVNHAKVQSKTNKYCKFHVDLTRRRLSKSRFKKLGMVPKKLYRNTLSVSIGFLWRLQELKRNKQMIFFSLESELFVRCSLLIYLSEMSITLLFRWKIFIDHFFYK